MSGTMENHTRDKDPDRPEDRPRPIRQSRARAQQYHARNQGNDKRYTRNIYQNHNQRDRSDCSVSTNGSNDESKGQINGNRPQHQQRSRSMNDKNGCITDAACSNGSNGNNRYKKRNNRNRNPTQKSNSNMMNHQASHDNTNHSKKNTNQNNRTHRDQKSTNKCPNNKTNADRNINASSSNRSCSSNSINSSSNKENDKQFRRDQYTILRQKSQENSFALTTYLQERGWSLGEDMILKSDLNSDYQIVGTTNATAPRESETLRKRALKLLETTMCRWASSIENNPTAWQQTRVTLITFGSYRLRAYRPDADVDLLALCPPSCTRDDFFTSLVEMMEAESAIGDIHPIASAYTPVLKFTIHNIHFDMLFGRVSGRTNIEKLQRYQRMSPCPILDMTNSHPAIQHLKGTQGGSATAPAEFTIEDSFLLGMVDDSEVRSANGVRVTQFLIDYVPHPERFRVVLCAVKEWATLHGIYSNVLGFLGGVNWAIMVAYVCKLYPNQNSSMLLTTFFQIFATWNWPSPVLLEEAEQQRQQLTASVAGKAATGTIETEYQKRLTMIRGGMKPWDPETNRRDARQLMPIITPVFPRMNSAYNVGIAQQRRIQEELVRAAFLTQDESNWRSLFGRSDFFERHANFLQISIRAGKNPEEFTKWLRLCESRLRLLISALDCPEMSVWPFAQLMKRTYSQRPAEVSTSSSGASESLPEALFFIGLRFAPNVESIDLKQHTSDFLINQINSWEGRKPEMDLMIHHTLQKDLPYDLISQYVVAQPNAFQIPNPTLFQRTASRYNENVFQNQTIHSSNSKHNNKATRTVAKPRPASLSHVPKDILGSNGGDTHSLARSTYSSIARSVNSSMPSEDGTEKSFDGIELDSRPHSPLGNFITVEGGPPTPQRQTNDCKKKGGTKPSVRKDEFKHSYHQTQLYEFLTGKSDGLLPTTKTAEDIDESFGAVESQSDQSSARSPIKKKPRNRSHSETKPCEKADKNE